MLKKIDIITFKKLIAKQQSLIHLENIKNKVKRLKRLTSELSKIQCEISIFDTFGKYRNIESIARKD